MALHATQYQAGLIFSDETSVHPEMFVEAARIALQTFGVSADVQTTFDHLTMTADSARIRLEIVQLPQGHTATTADTGATVPATCGVRLQVTQTAALPVDHPQAAQALLVELVHACLEQTGAPLVEWQEGGVLTAARFQDAVPCLRHPRPAMAEEARGAAPEATNVVAMPRRVKPATAHRAAGIEIDMGRYRSTKRLVEWVVDGQPVAKRHRPAEPLQDVFRKEVELPRELIAANQPKASLERRIASWTIAATLALTAPGMSITQAMASTLQALPF